MSAELQLLLPICSVTLGKVMTEDASKLLEYMHGRDPLPGTYVVIGDIMKALAWDRDRAQAAMSEAVSKGYAEGTPAQNAICVPSRR